MLPPGSRSGSPGSRSTRSVGNKARADLSDVRVIGDGALGERHRIIDPTPVPRRPRSASRSRSPLAPGATTTAYAIYYGNTNAGAPPADGTKVFTNLRRLRVGHRDVVTRSDAPAANNGQLVLRANHLDA